MNRTGFSTLILVFALLLSLLAPGVAQEAKLKLGEISFPNSGAPAAQDHFIRGVLYLHSFIFEDAQEEFRAAQKADPTFALAYWGEAMSYNMPLWRRIQTEDGRVALNRLAPTLEGRLAQAPTEREKALLRAVEHIFFGEGDKTARDLAYSEAMGRLHSAHPDDHEIASLYALSILGRTNGTRNVRNYMRAAAIVEEVTAANPGHPGAAHYLIHSYDDPTHAPLGLRAARRYNRIAPDASHAQHMVSHIFVALGMWPEAERANQRAWEVSLDRVKRKDLGIDQGDFHSYSWLHYSLLQQGQPGKAAKMVALTDQAYAENEAARVRSYRSYMNASQVVETRSTGALLQAQDGAPFDLYADAWAAIHREDAAAARALAAKLPTNGTINRIHKMQIEAMIALLAGDKDKAVEMLTKAAAEEDAMPIAFGPPRPIKPTHELLGEVLLSMGRAEEARAEFTQALERAPNRRLSTAGLAQADHMLTDEAPH